MPAEADSRLKTPQLTVRKRDAVDADVVVPGSKSYTNRYVAIASLSGRETVIEGALLADDTRYLASAIEAFGHVRVAIDDENRVITVVPTGEPMRVPAEEIYVGGAGTPIRFLIG